MSAKPKQIRKLADLTPDSRNVNQGTPQGAAVIEDSLRTYGAGRSIVVDRNGAVIGGNKTLEGAASVGLNKIRVVQTQGDELVVVQRTDLDLENDPRARGLALVDNRASEVSYSPDEALLAEMLAELTENDEAARAAAGYSDEDVKALLESVAAAERKANPKEDKGPQIDRAAELQEKWQVQRGQVWSIGSHRLMCGDSTNYDDVSRLMDFKRASLLATDPPYNVGIEYGESVDDEKRDAEYEAFRRAWFESWRVVSDRQVVTPGYNNLACWILLFGKPYHFAAWTKTNSMTRGHVSRFACYEPVVFYGQGWKRERPNDVFDFPVSAQATSSGESLTQMHPCPKPLGMWVDLLESYTDESDLIADAFAGSGTAMVAAEQTNRICYGMEIEPKYCAVTLERTQALGLEPKLL